MSPWVPAIMPCGRERRTVGESLIWPARRGQGPRRESLAGDRGGRTFGFLAKEMLLPPKAELEWWDQYYFATERGRAGYDQHRHHFAKLIRPPASPKWHFDDAPFARSA